MYFASFLPQNNNYFEFEMSFSALAKLTATYTDSENEDKEDDSPNSGTSNNSVAVLRNVTPVNSPPRKKRKKSRKLRRLVSYKDDTIVDEESADSGSSTSENEEEEDVPMERSRSEIALAESHHKVDTDKILEKYSHYKFKLPPKPTEKPSASVTEKITTLYEKMETKQMDMNKLIQERKEFRNPSIYEKLIEFCEIDEFGTNYPSDVYDPKKWRKSEMNSYVKLAEAQKEEMLKKQKDRKNAVEVSKIPSGSVDEAPKKTKWDQKPEVKKPVTRLVTGNKGKKIPAMGPLK